MSDLDTLNDELKPGQRKAVRALIATGNVALAAADCGVSPRTMRRWLTDEQFREELRAAEMATLQTATRRLGQLAEKALRTLEEVMDDVKVPPACKVRAAGMILESAWKWQEIASLEQRLALLERQAVTRLPSASSAEVVADH